MSVHDEPAVVDEVVNAKAEGFVLKRRAVVDLIPAIREVCESRRYVSLDVQLKFYDVWGTEQTYNHMSAGWSWAFDTPFSWFKQNASQLGGINQNMVVSWSHACRPET